MFSKKGVSDVVASVLVVLIVVVAVAILWMAVSRFLVLEEEDFDTDVKILINKGYTFYDEENNLLSMQVERGGDVEEVEKLKFVLNLEKGNSVEIFYDDVLAAGSTKTYSYVFADDAVVPSYASVAPVFDSDGKKVGEMSERVKIPRKKAIDIPTETNYVVLDEDNEVDVRPLRFVDSCRNLSEEGAIYRLSKNISSLREGNCFNIDADGILLDCEGYWVSADGLDARNYAMIHISGNNVEVKNCNLNAVDTNSRVCYDENDDGVVDEDDADILVPRFKDKLVKEVLKGYEHEVCYDVHNNGVIFDMNGDGKANGLDISGFKGFIDDVEEGNLDSYKNYMFNAIQVQGTESNPVKNVKLFNNNIQGELIEEEGVEKSKGFAIGVYVLNSENIEINNCVSKENIYGIRIQNSDGIDLSNNKFCSNSMFDVFDHSSSNLNDLGGNVFDDAKSEIGFSSSGVC